MVHLANLKDEFIFIAFQILVLYIGPDIKHKYSFAIVKLSTAEEGKD
jgi:hypothetical protein